MEDDVVGVAAALVRRDRDRERGPARHAPLLCPACDHELIATDVSTVRVDFCIAHGTWLDHDDIGAIASAIQIASSGNANQKDWEARLTGDLGVLPKGLVTALGTVIAVGEHARRVHRARR
jgi:Zn-finger nucleic acid-binding protein